MASFSDKLKYSAIGRRIRNLNFLKITVVKPSTVFLTGIIIAVSIFILGGGVYNLLEKPLALLPGANGWLFIYPGLYAQTWNESIYSMSMMTLGIVGTLVCYRSTRYAFKPRQAKIFLMLGAVLLIVAIIGFEYALYMKVSSGTA
jgi:hypothetical protein